MNKTVAHIVKTLLFHLFHLGLLFAIMYTLIGVALITFLSTTSEPSVYAAIFQLHKDFSGGDSIMTLVGRMTPYIGVLATGAVAFSYFGQVFKDFGVGIKKLKGRLFP